MALSQLYTGTEAVGATEHSLTTDTTGPDADTTAGIFQTFIDVDDMVTGDKLRIRIYEKCRSGDTQRIVYESVLEGEQGSQLVVTPALYLVNGWDVTLLALAGTITCNWSIRSVA
jgi:hypothetical protein